MNFSKIFFFLLLSVIVVFSSCKDEEISQDVVTEQPVTPEEVTFNPLVANVQASASSEDGLDLGCFTIDFPFALNVGGIEVSITNEEDFTNALQDTVEYVDFVYPLNITYPDGTTDSVADGEALGEAFASCVPDGGWDVNTGDFPAYLICDLNSCYQIVYPLNLVDGDGNTYIATNEEEFIELIAEHFDLFFEFPVNLLNEDGETVSAESDEDLFELLASCEEIIWPNDTLDWNGGGVIQFGCYDFEYPIILLDEDGNATSVDNADDFFNAILNGDFSTFGFPMNLINEDGETFVVNNEEEFDQALLDCPGVVLLEIPLFLFYQLSSNSGVSDCYEILYPFDIIDVAGGAETVNNDAELENFLNNDQWFVTLPVNILTFGEELTITDAAMMAEVWETCE